MHAFPLVDRYLGLSLDIDIAAMKPGEQVMAESPRRLACELSYGFIHALYALAFVDGRLAVSVTPGALTASRGLFESDPPDPRRPSTEDYLVRLAGCISAARVEAGLPPAGKPFESFVFACNAPLLRRYRQGDCRRLRDDRIPPAEGLRLPSHCFPDGLVYGIIEDEQVVSVAYAHRSGKMEDRVADLGVETAPAYRKRGYARTVVSAVTEAVVSSGGEAVYSCSVSNQASMATAQSVGYVWYAKALVVSAPEPGSP